MASKGQHNNGAVQGTPEQFKAWMGEIANLINTKPLTVIQTIELTTNKKFIGTTYGDLARAVGTLLKTNLRFQAAMVILVHLNNGLINYNQITSGDYLAALYSYNGGAPRYKNDASDPLTGILNVASSAMNMVGNITSASLAKQTAKTNATANVTIAGDNLAATEDTADAAVQTELMRTVQAKLNTEGGGGAARGSGTAGTGNTGNSNTLLIALVVILGIGGVFLFSRSTGNAPSLAAPKKEAGGGVSVPPPLPIAPVATPAAMAVPGAVNPALQLIPGVDEIKF